MDDRAERIARRFELPMLVAAVLVVPLLVLEESRPTDGWATVATVLNWGTWLAFATEVVVMLAVVPDRRRWLREHPVEVVVTLLTPPVLPPGLAIARLLRLLRILQLLRLVVPLRRFLSTDGLRYAAILAFMTMLGGGVAFASAEREHSAWDGIWWAVTTMTTVGYGDVTPETDLGRIIAMVVMVVGIGFGTLLIGAIAERFVFRDREPAPSTPAPAHPAPAPHDAAVLAELRALGTRLDALEALLRERRG